MEKMAHPESSKELFNQAQNLRDGGRPQEALPFYDRAIELATPLKEQLTYLQQRGVALREMGDFDKSLDVLREALEGFRKIKNKEGMGNTWRDIGITFLTLARFAQAADALRKSQVILLGTQEDPGGLALSVVKEGLALYFQQDSQAEERMKQARALAQRALDESGGKTWWPLSTVLTDYSKFFFLSKKYSQAGNFAQQAISVTQEGIKTDQNFAKETRQDKRLASLYILLNEVAKIQGDVYLERLNRQRAEEYLRGLNPGTRAKVKLWLGRP